MPAGAFGDRQRLLLAMIATILALPLLVIDNLPASARAETVTAAAARTRSEVAVPDHRVVRAAPIDTTSTTVAPTTTSSSTTTPPTTVARATVRAAAPVTTTTARPRPTTTTTHPPTTTTTAAPEPTATSRSQEGMASWYDYKAGTCAHRTLALGTVVTVINKANGRRATCTVADRGPYGEGRIIDLDRSVFSKLASTSDGVISVRIEW